MQKHRNRKIDYLFQSYTPSVWWSSVQPRLSDTKASALNYSSPLPYLLLCPMKTDLVIWIKDCIEPWKPVATFFLPALFSRLISCSGDTGSLVLADGKGDLKCHITANPFKVDLVSEEEVVMSINSLGQLYFEHLQIPPKQRYFFHITWHIKNLRNPDCKYQ